MVEIRDSTGRQTIVAQCRDACQRQASIVLRRICELEEQGAKLVADQTIDYGFSMLYLAEDPLGLRVLEPDYNGNPRLTWHSDISTTAEVTEAQRVFLDQIGEKTLMDAKYCQTVRVSPGSLLTRNIYMLRQASGHPEESGWYVGPQFEEPRPPMTMFLYQLLFVRAELLQAVLLPTNYIVVFSGDRIQGVQDPSENERWPSLPA